jgi:hypothetical protein
MLRWLRGRAAATPREQQRAVDVARLATALAFRATLLKQCEAAALQPDPANPAFVRLHNQVHTHTRTVHAVAPASVCVCAIWGTGAGVWAGCLSVWARADHGAVCACQVAETHGEGRDLAVFSDAHVHRLATAQVAAILAVRDP